MIIKPAVRTQRKLRVALIGPSGSGKTKSALELAKEWGKKILVIDTEHGSASIYADDKTQFDTIQLTSFHPQFYINAIKLGKDYDVLIIDSLSHAWMGKDGALSRLTAQQRQQVWQQLCCLEDSDSPAQPACRNHAVLPWALDCNHASKDRVLDGNK